MTAKGLIFAINLLNILVLSLLYAKAAFEGQKTLGRRPEATWLCGTVKRPGCVLSSVMIFKTVQFGAIFLTIDLHSQHFRIGAIKLSSRHSPHRECPHG